MTVRINNLTAESGETAAWSPAADTLIQVHTDEGSTAVVELFGRADAAAPYESVASVKLGSEAFIHLPVKLQSVKLVWSANRDGKHFSAWSVE
ncbi:hypothetical protein [Oryzifoliimicrobium ureilyticus]|uniref:hypothetical protein n=1 Tax=Oryzifoliimicrobium ureilyticus TaxID=3113724 RepID=UPI0030768278